MTIHDGTERRWKACLLPLPLLAALSLAPAPAGAAELQVTFSASVAGFPVGKAAVDARMSGNEYAISGSGRVSGISALFTDGKGKASVSGRLQDQAVRPVRYTHTIVDDEKETLDMTFAGVRVDNIVLTQPEKRNKRKKKNRNPSNAVPLTEQHKAGVMDPLSVFLLPVAELTGDAVCNRTLPLFDGEQRFDLVMRYDRSVKREGMGVFVCAISYRPIAGYKPEKKSIKFMVNNKKIEVWLAPVGATGFVAPVEAHVKTQIGMLVIKADSFVVRE